MTQSLQLLMDKRIWWHFKKYAIINIWHSGNKVLLLDYDCKNNPSLPRLPKCKDKEKR
jgi:hypothetical protein